MVVNISNIGYKKEVLVVEYRKQNWVLSMETTIWRKRVMKFKASQVLNWFYKMRYSKTENVFLI